MNDQERIEIATLASDIKHIREKVECLPALCTDVARHDERLKGVEEEARILSTRFWLLVSGLAMAWLGLIGMIIKGG